MIIVNNILKNVIQNISYVKDEQKLNNLNSPDLLEIEELIPILTKVNFLSNIVSESGEYFSMTTPISLLDNEFCNIISIISNLKENKNLDNLSKLISIMHKNNENINIIDKFFPYNHFAFKNESKLICHLLSIIVKLNREKNDFNIIVSGINYNFKYNNNSNFIPTFLFTDYNNIVFGIGTCIQFGDISKLSGEEKKKNSFEFPSNLKTLDELYKNSLMFIYVTGKCLEEKIKQKKNLKKHVINFNKEIIIIDSQLDEKCIYLNNFYINDNSPMIAKLWNLLYFINNKNIINNLINILNKLESNMLDVASKLLDDINFNEIELYSSFTKKMVNFCKRNSILWKIILNQNLFEKKETKEEALKIRDKLLEEKKYIETIYNFKNIWKNNEYIKYIDKCLEIINKKILKFEKENEKLILEQKIADLIKKLNSTGKIDETMQKMKESYKSIFEKGERTKAFLEECELKVSAFLKNLENSKQELKKSIWPSYYPTIEYKYENKETYSNFFNCLLWYSETSSLLKTYFENNNSENSISICQKLIKNGLETISEFINYKETNRQTITAKETEKLFSMIKMQFLYKLIDNHCYEKILIMRKSFNDIKERNFLKEKDYKWIFDISKKYQLDFSISFPNFNNPKDLLFLFLSITNDPTTFKEGPIKIGEKDKELIDELKDKVNYEIKTYEECANIITKAIYNVYINKTESLESESKGLKLFFDNKIDEFKENTEKKFAIEILKKCKFILEIGEDLSRKDETKLEFDDIEFLNNKVWEFGEKIAKKYPSLVYWLIKNENCYLEMKNNRILIEWYNNTKNNDVIEYIPFFVLCLRLMSSFNCIIFELINPKKSEYQEDMQKYITKEIIKGIEKRSEENMTIKWFNIMLKSVPSYIYDENYRFFYCFLNYLIEGYKNLDDFPKKIKDEEVNIIIKNIINLVMNEKINDEIKKIFKKEDKASEVLYLFDPAKMIFDKIKNSKDEKLTNFINNEEYLKIESQIKALVNKKIPKIIEKLEKGIQEDINEFAEEAEIEYQKEKDSCLKKLYGNIDKINQYLDDIITDVEINENMTFPQYAAKIKEYLSEINSILNEQVNKKIYESLFDKNKQIEIYSCFYVGPSRGDTYKIINKEDQRIVHEESGVKGQINILFPKLKFQVKYEKEMKEAKISIIENKNFNKIYFKLDKNKLDKNNFFKSNKIEKASLEILFQLGHKNYESKDAVNFIKEFVSKIQNSLSFFKEIKNKNFENCCAYPKLILSEIRKFKPEIKYTKDNTKDNADYALNELIDSFSTLEKYYDELISLLKEPEKVSNENKSIRESKFIFSNILKVKIPELSDSYLKVGFKNIKNYNSLISPIISIEQHTKQLICSLNEINIFFKSIIGPLYNDSKYTLTFMSSVNEKLDLKLDFTHDFYKRYFSYQIDNEKIKIFVKVPINEENDENNIEIKGDIKFISKSYSELTIPFNLSFRIFPLQILFGCEEYLISFNNGTYCLCVDRIISNSVLHFSSFYNNFKEKVIQSINLISLDENKAPIPELNSENPENIELKINGDKKKVVRLKCIVNFAFSKKLIVPLNINAVVVPFDFAFEVYDYCTKKFSDTSSTIIFSDKNKIVKFEPITIKFRIYLPNIFNKEEFNGKIYHSYLPNFIKIINQEEIDNKLFKIKDEFEFEIKLQFINKEYKDANFFIYAEIEGIHKKIVRIDLSQTKIVKPNALYERINHYGYIKYSQFDYLNEDAKYYNNYKKIEDHYKEKNNIFGYSFQKRINFYSQKSNNFGFFKDHYNFDWVINYDAPFSRNKLFFIIMYYDPQTKFWVPYPTIYPKELDEFKKFDIFQFGLTKDILDKETNEKKKFFKDFSEKSYEEKSFGFLIKKLDMENQTTNNLKNLINLFPADIKNKLENELNKIENKRNYIFLSNEVNKWICYYNFILELYDIFKKRYNELLEINKKNEEVEKILIKINKEFYTIKSKNLNELNDNKKRLNELEKNYGKLKAKLKNNFNDMEYKYEKMLLTEKSFLDKKPPEVKSKKNKPISKESKNENNLKNLNSEKNTGMTIKNLENIEVPKEISIMNLSKFYSNCIKNIKIMPLIVRDIFLSEGDKEKDFDIIEKYYMKLKKLYLFLTNSYDGINTKDSSILSLKIEQFIHNFIIMVSKFKSAEPKLNLDVKISLDENEQINDFIREPKLNDFSLGINEWKTQQKLNTQNTLFLTDEIAEKSSLNRNNTLKELKEDKNKRKESTKSKKINLDDLNFAKLNEKKIKEDKQIDLNNLIKIELNKGNDEDDNSYNYLEEASDEEEDKKGSKFNNNNNKQKNYSNEKEHDIKKRELNLENYLKNINVKEGIERITNRLEELDEKKELDINYKNKGTIDTKLLKPDNSNFSVKDLFINSLFISSYIIKESSDYEIPYENMCANILIDCSGYINNINKIYNLIAVYGLLEGLYELKIPYSITMISDENFRAVIKDFNEAHSKEVIQKILDCAMIKRFKSNYAKNLKFSIDNLKYYNSNRKQRAFYLFSDGLNEDLKLSKSWADLILNDENNSFGFIFIKSPQILNVEIWKKVWDNFDIKVKERDASSFTRVFTYEDSDLFSEENVINFARTICSVLSRREEFHIDTSSQKKLIHSFQLEDEYIPLDEKTLLGYLNNCRNKKYNKFREIYLKVNNEKDLSQSPPGTEEKIRKENLGKILNTPLREKENRNNLKELIKEYSKNKKEINLINLESIYKPNKASQYVLSSTGTDFDITALVLNLINPVPEPLIYLEEKGGLMRNYRVTIILDTSISCLSRLSFLHTFQTLNYLLCSCSCLDLPCFDFIAARDTNPILICSEIGTINALNEKSDFWSTLFTIFNNPVVNCNLSSALKLAYELRRIRSLEKGSFLYVLTDGLYQYNERKEILKCINDCEQSGINVIGIGVGIYPKGIEKLFTNSLYCREPSTLIKAISYFFGEEISVLNYMPDLLEPPSDKNEINEIINKLKNTKPDYENLKVYLENIPPGLDAMQDIYNSEQDIGNEETGFHNIPEGKNTQIYVKNSLKGQKILIVMLYEEGNEITIQKIYEPLNKNAKCIYDAAKHFGISITTVTNYKDATKELKKQTKKGYCDYYAVWVLSSNGNTKLQPKDPIGEFNFVQLLIRFWRNGGSLVLFTDNHPFTHEVNLFLKEVKFPNGKNADFSMSGNHNGTKLLNADSSGKLNKNRSFNRNPLIFEECQRSSLAHNLGIIYEGVTIAYCSNTEKMEPFIPFAKDSDGGITILYYCAESKFGTGDIILDGGYTKLFINMEKEGTFKYVQNIIGWTARPEVHIIVDKISPKEWRPKALI